MYCKKRFLFLLLLALVAACSYAAEYYVNDAFTNGDIYCSAIGSDANSGTSAAAPMATVTNVLATYDLDPGDTVWIDSGSYTQSLTIVSNDQGSASGYVSFKGNTNDTQATKIYAPGNVIVWDVKGARYIEISHMSIHDGARAIYVRDQSHYFKSHDIWAINCDTALRSITSDYGKLSNWLVFNEVFEVGSLGIEIITASDDWTLGGSVFYNVGRGFPNTSEISVSNCVFYGGEVFYGATIPQSGDYNVFYSNTWASGYTTLVDVQKDQDGWWNCVVMDPQFADAANGDFHPRSPSGRWDPNTGWATTDTNTSVLVDFGAETSDFSNEPAPNGARVNAGLYGNTDEASKGRTNQTLVALTYNDGGTLDAGSDKVYWYQWGFTNETVRIEYSAASGAEGSWETVATNLPATNLVYQWANTNFSSSLYGRWRVVCESDTNIADAVDQDFVHRNGAFVYYVNDNSQVDDVFCTAVGDNGNLGTSPGAPKASLQAILQTYDLEPGDVVRVDTGSYNLNSTLVVGAGDSGAATNYVRIVGSTNGTTIVRNQTVTGITLQFDGAQYVSVEDLILTGASVGLDTRNGASGLVFSHISSIDNTRSGAEVASSSAQFDQCILAGNGQYGIYVDFGSASVSNSVLFNNGEVAAYSEDVLSLKHNVIGVQAAGSMAMKENGLGGAISSDWNAVSLENNAVFGWVDSLSRMADDLSSWTELTGQDAHSLETDPLFVDADNGDYHLQSAAGRWAGTNWVLDAQTSPLIDAGDTVAVYTNETSPNGGRVNMGLYGNTAEASRSSTQAVLLATSPRNGGWLTGTGNLAWKAYGVATGHTVTIEFSGDGGVNWSVLTNGLAATNEVFSWDTTTTNDTPAALWRISSEQDGAVTDAVTNFFAIRNSGGLDIYVNDGDTAGDMYCAGVGVSNNWTATSNAPLDSLATALRVYDLESGDTVWVDTGMYAETEVPTVSRRDSGSGSSDVVIQASTNGVTVDGGGTLAAGLLVEDASYVSVNGLRLVNSAQGAEFRFATASHWKGGEIVSNSVGGVLVEDSAGVDLDRLVVAENGGDGVSLVDSSGVTLDNSVVWSNASGAVAVDSSHLKAYGNVLSAHGEGAVVWTQSAGSITSDYNNVYAEGAAAVAQVGSRVYGDLFAWQVATSNELWSVAGDPLFADAGGYDFHVQSITGRYVAGAGYVTNDLVHSPLIDAGRPTSTYSNETVPNGGRVNIGLYGNTAESSLSRTGAWFTALTLNDGGAISATNTLRWNAGNAATGEVVDLEISLDGGVTWTNIADDLAAGTTEYEWDTTLFGTVPQVLWRVISSVDTSLYDVVDTAFLIQNGPVTYYVNDSSAVGDRWCSQPGAAENDGTTTNSPLSGVDEVFNNYSVRPMDSIYVDAGNYALSEDLSINNISGQETNRFLLRGAGENYGSGTRFTGSGLVVTNSHSVYLKDLVFAGQAVGLEIKGSTNTLVEGVRTEGCGTGVRLDDSPSVQLVNVITEGSTYGVYQLGTKQTTYWDGGVAWSNRYAFYQTRGSLSVSNAVLGGFGSTQYLYYRGTSAGTLNSEDNNLVLHNGAYVAIQDATDDVLYPLVSRWARDTGRDTRSLSHEPGFVDAENGDFHPVSRAGHWDPVLSAFTNDTQDSVLVDTAASGAVYTNETGANGARRNLGAYGNTTSASISSTNGRLLAVSLNDGGRAEGDWPLYWRATGVATGHTVHIDYSATGGGNWQIVATNVPATNEVYVWSSTNFESSVFGVWRIYSEQDAFIWDTNDAPFALRNEPLSFYVNDGDTNNDVYCSAAGSSLNNGAYSNSPLDSVQAVIDLYDLEPGDTIYVDTGTYTNSNTVSFGRFDAGENGNWVTVQGSTHADGSVFNGNGFEASQAPGIRFADLIVTGVSTAIRFNSADYGQVERVRALDCSTGFNITDSDAVNIQHSVARDGTYGVYHTSGSSGRFDSGVLWSNTYGIYYNSGSLGVSNSIVAAFGSNSYAYRMPTSYGGFVSDYNAVYLHNGAIAVTRATSPLTTTYDTLSRWTRDTGRDVHSYAGDPLMADASAGDYHLRTQHPDGRVLPDGSKTNDVVTSPLIDAAHSSLTVADEPAPNGDRRNIGLYGGTDQASATPTNAALQVLSLNDGGRAEDEVSLYWTAVGVATGHTVSIEYSYDGGASWSNIVSGVAASAGSVVWTSSPYASSPLGSWRITSDEDGSVSDTNDVLFALRNVPLDFYVNDAVSGPEDVYCTAVGDDGNDGLLPSTPMASLNTVIETYDLEPEDTVFLDTGTYTISANPTLSFVDSGSSEGFVTIQGSTNAVDGGTELLASGASIGLYVDEAPYVRLRHLTLAGFPTGIKLGRYSDHAVVEWCRISGGTTGIELTDTDSVQMSHNLIRNTGSRGLYQAAGTGNKWDSGVLWSNGVQAVYLNNGSLAVSNSIMGIFGSSSRVYYFQNGYSGLASEHNAYLLDQDTSFAYWNRNPVPVEFANLSRWARDTGKDIHSYAGDPGFVDVANTDFHLLSEGGRYDWVVGWTNDASTSDLLDAASVNADIGDETAPNGNRRNIGLYGGTDEASRTPTNAYLSVLSLNDGGRAEDVVTLRWLARGEATNYMVDLAYSADGGTSWTSIAQSVSASAETYSWTSTTYQSSVFGSWRVQSTNDATVLDTNDVYFALRNESLAFYVNDASTNGDVYCSAVGDDELNTGVDGAHPMATISKVLDTYDIEPGDTIYVDTGDYLSSQSITFGVLDAWDRVTEMSVLATNRENLYVTLQGSTNEVAGGTVLQKFGGGGVISLQEAAGVALRNLSLLGGSSGVLGSESHYGAAEWVRAESSGTGFDLDDCDYFELQHCLALENSSEGFYTRNGSGVVWEQGVLWSNKYGVWQSGGSLSVENSIIGAFGEEKYAYVWDGGSLTSDYNNILLGNNALAGLQYPTGASNRFENLAYWADGVDKDRHSLSVQPGFADLSTQDFHLKTTALGGRYDAIAQVWTNDVDFSVLIDAGRPETDFSEEPLPNGERVNIGLFGGTLQASHTPTNQWLNLITLNDGGTATGTQTVYWVAGGAASTQQVDLAYSMDGGASWTNLVSGHDASLGFYDWVTTNFQSTAVGLLRLQLSGDSNVVDVTDSFFSIRQPGSGVRFYVNDDSTSGDVYCNAIGSAGNLGVLSNAPAASIMQVLDAFKLQAFDEIYVDTGTYNLDQDTEITDLDSGSDSNYVYLVGSTNLVAGGTVLDRQSAGAGNAAIKLSSARWVDISNMTLVGGAYGVVSDGARDCNLNGVRMQDNAGAGMSLDESSNIAFFNSIIWNNGGGTNVAALLTKSSLAWNNGVMWGNGGAIRFEQSSGSISNSVLQASGEGYRVYSFNTQSGLSSLKSDYNNLVVEYGALIAENENTSGGSDLYGTVTEWAKDSGNDLRSLAHEPGFVDEINGEFHLLSSEARYSLVDGWVSDSQVSVCMDVGAPEAVFTNETSPNGARVNIGAYGNTWQASRSRTNAWVLAVSLNDGGIISGTNMLYWVSGNMSSGDTVRIDYSDNNGLDWSALESGLAYDNPTGMVWDASTQPPVAQGLWRVVAENYSNTYDAVDEAFTIKNNPITLYVNDVDTNGDVYCTAPGSSGNTGLDPAQPLDNPATALQLYSLSAGDALFVDTGIYDLSSTLSLGELNRGTETFPVRLVGSTNSEGTLFRVDTNFTGSVLSMNGAHYVDVSDFKIQGAVSGVSLQDALNIRILGVESFSNRSSGFTISDSTVYFDRCASWGNAGWGVQGSGNKNQLRWNRGVNWNNGLGGFSMGQGSLTVSNSILNAAYTNSYLYSENKASVVSDWNVLWREPYAGFAYDGEADVEYANMQEWQRSGARDDYSLLVDPLFVDAEAGDFRLRSAAGTWAGTNYVAYSNTSWAIDAGALTSEWTNEPAPNGTRLNSGLYGNTIEASLTDTNDRSVLMASLEEGGLVSGDQLLYWAVRGLTATDTVSLQYSADNGMNWQDIESGVPAITTGYVWDAQSATSSPLALVRVVYEGDTNVWDASGQPFLLRTGPFSYYVNDTDTNGDVYAQAPGAATNLGAFATQPMLKLADVVNTYDIEPGDTVYVDTGVYIMTNQVLFTSLDGGMSTASVSIVGSTNWMEGGSVLRPATNGAPTAAFAFSQASYIDVQDFVIEGFSKAVQGSVGGSGHVLRRLDVRDSSGVAIDLSKQGGVLLDQLIITRGGARPIHLSQSSATLLNSVVWSNSGGSVGLYKSTISISNTVLSAMADGASCVYIETNGTYSGDFNNFFVTNGAYYAYEEGLPYESLPQWTVGREQDVHTLAVDPMFADSANDDFHLMSTAGRFDPVGASFVTNDVETSPLIDAGPRAWALGDEPVPNGERINIGRYGGTDQASKSLTNEWIRAITASSGGRLLDTFYFSWVPGVALASTGTVSIDVSLDNGLSWTNVGVEVPVTNDVFLWNSQPNVSPLARWRVVYEPDTNVFDMTDSAFALNGPFLFYVNDASTNGDVYATAIGDPTNVGFYAASPMDTPDRVLDTYDLEGGDKILIDTGVYSITNAVALTLGDAGNEAVPVYIRGNTNAYTTVLEKGPGGPSSLVVLDADYAELSDLVLIGGGLSMPRSEASVSSMIVSNGAITLSGSDLTGRDLTLYGGSLNLSGTDLSVAGAEIRNGRLILSGTNAVVANALVTGTATSAVVASGNNVTVRNSTLAADGTQVSKTGFGTATLENNIIIADGQDNFCIVWADGALNSDYNNLLARNGAWIGSRDGYWERLLYWQRASGLDEYSLSTEPSFADEAGGDYHLKSVSGRWVGTGWTNDVMDSPALDVGNPVSVYTNENAPNGGRINIGAYANTAEASLSRSNAWLQAMTMNDSGVLKGTNVLMWTGGNLPVGQTVALEYSPDNGVTWTTVVSGVDVTNTSYEWDTTAFESSLMALWRIVLESDTNVFDEVDSIFAVRNVPLAFYVNDADTFGDVYTDAIGSDAQDGLTTNTPMETLQNVLDTYDLEGGDVVKVDTGTYNLSDEIDLIWSRSGEADASLLIRGSTNYADGGSAFERNSRADGAYGFNLKGDYVTLKDLVIQDAYAGVFFNTNTYSSAEDLFLISNAYAVVMRNAYSITNQRLRVWNNQSGGIQAQNTRTVLVENCTFVGNSNWAVRLDGTVGDTLQNNIVYVNSSNTTAWAGTFANVDQAFIDYNVYWSELAEPFAFYPGYSDLRLWQLNVEHDFRSAVTNPVFANVDVGDFHLLSTRGYFDEGLNAWTTSGSDSWAIDKANPNTSFVFEPEPDGNRANPGAFGNTVFASMGVTGLTPVIEVRSLNDATFITSTNGDWPLIWNAQNLPEDMPMLTQYSGDGGDSWYTLATNSSPYGEYVVWNSSPFFNTFKGLWRVYGVDTNTGIVYSDTNNANFQLFYGEYEITDVAYTTGLNRITWRGAWDEVYTVQYADMADINLTNPVVTGRFLWTNAPSGPGLFQTNEFLSTYGGDFQYEDVESTGTAWRVYRVIRTP